MWFVIILVIIVVDIGISFMLCLGLEINDNGEGLKSQSGCVICWYGAHYNWIRQIHYGTVYNAMYY